MLLLFRQSLRKIGHLIHQSLVIFGLNPLILGQDPPGHIQDQGQGQGRGQDLGLGLLQDQGLCHPYQLTTVLL